MTIFTVGSAAELSAALSKAAGGDRIELKAGNYGSVSVSGKAFASGVTIAAQSKAAPPVFNDMHLMNCKNISLDGLKFNFVPNANTMEWTPALEVRNGSGISVLNSTFTGGNAVAGSPNALSNYGVQGMAVGRGMVFMGTTNVNITNNTMTGFTHSIRFVDVDGAQVNHNDISGFRRAAVSGSDVDNVSVNGNFFHDPHPWNFGPKGDHGDFIHLWTDPGQPDANTNITIKDNYLDQGKGTGILGIFLNDKTGKAFQNVVIEDNVVHTGNGQGMRLEGVHGGTIRMNTVVGNVLNAAVVPKIIFDHGNANLLVDKNIFMGTGGNQAPGTANNIVLGNNMTVQMQSAAKPNYMGNIFVDGVNASPSLTSFLVKAAAASGMGAVINGTTPTTTGPAGNPGGGMGTGTGTGTGTTTGGSTVPVKTAATLPATDKMTAGTAPTTDKTTAAPASTTDKMAVTTTDKMAADIAPTPEKTVAVADATPIKIDLAGDTFQFDKMAAPADTSDAPAGDTGVPKVVGDSFDFSDIGKVAPADPVKMTTDVKMDGDLVDGDGGDSQPVSDHHVLPGGDASDHFAFVDGHHPAADLLFA
ncbi:MAG: right-handed parallel beta-helix repeat-containing protein [Paracoccaceae bacterium]